MAVGFEKYIFQITDRSKHDKSYDNGNDSNRNKEWLPTYTRRSLSPGNQNGIKFIDIFIIF